MGSKRNISFMKPPEPKFIQKMKEQIGYQEPDTVNTKKQKLQKDTEDLDYDDEKPVIVTLKPGDLTEEEFEKEITVAENPNKKIVFSRPIKHDSGGINPLICSSKKSNDDELKKRVQDRNEKSKQVKNSSLLSFDDEEEDDEEE